jgi:hypothetical protein
MAASPSIGLGQVYVSPLFSLHSMAAPTWWFGLEFTTLVSAHSSYPAQVPRLYFGLHPVLGYAQPTLVRLQECFSLIHCLIHSSSLLFFLSRHPQPKLLFSFDLLYMKRLARVTPVIFSHWLALGPLV